MLIWMSWLITLAALIVAGFAVSMVLMLRRQLAALRADYERQAASVAALQGAMKTISDGVVDHTRAQSEVQEAMARLQARAAQVRSRDQGPGGGS